MNWPFRYLPSYEHRCPLCGYHMLRPKEGEPFCYMVTCEDGKKNQEKAHA